MTDSRLQELKRAWEASGSVEDEAAYLRERVRVGDLTQERLELAAYCGHEGAREAMQESAIELAAFRGGVGGVHGCLNEIDSAEEFEGWIEGLCGWSPCLVQVALLALASLSLKEEATGGACASTLHQIYDDAAERLAAVQDPLGEASAAPLATLHALRSATDLPEELLGSAERGHYAASQFLLLACVQPAPGPYPIGRSLPLLWGRGVKPALAHLVARNACLAWLL